MKETLRKKLYDEINRIHSRLLHLLEDRSEFASENNFQEAMKTDIKYNELKMVAQSLKKLLD